MTLLRSGVAAIVLCSSAGASKAETLDQGYAYIYSPEAQAAYANLKARNYDTNYLNVDQLRLFTYLSNKTLALSIVNKVKRNQPLTGVDKIGVRLISNSKNLISSLPKIGQLGYNTPDPPVYQMGR